MLHYLVQLGPSEKCHNSVRGVQGSDSPHQDVFVCQLHVTIVCSDTGRSVTVKRESRASDNTDNVTHRTCITKKCLLIAVSPEISIAIESSN